MADLSITAANVKPNSVLVAISPVTLGETITAGQPLYKSTTDGKYYRADADVASTARVDGICILGGTADTVGIIQRAGELQIGATVTKGETYVVSTNVGQICPRSDLAAGDFISILGVAKSTSVLRLVVSPTEISI
jgi:hypothetical protein